VSGNIIVPIPDDSRFTGISSSRVAAIAATAVRSSVPAARYM
jgi:hypothetical protein